MAILGFAGAVRRLTIALLAAVAAAGAAAALPVHGFVPAFLLLAAGALSVLLLFLAAAQRRKVAAQLALLEDQMQTLADDLGSLARFTGEIAAGKLPPSYTVRAKPLGLDAPGELGQLVEKQNLILASLEEAGYSIAGITSGLEARIASARLELGNTNKALMENELRLNTIFETVKSGMILIDEETHRIVEANHYAARLIGDSQERIVGAQCHNFICPAEKGKCPISDLGLLVDNSERVLLTADGRRVPIIKSVVPLEFGGRRYLLENFIDISERKQAEEEIRKLNAELETRVAERTAELAEANESLQREVAERRTMEEALRESEKRLRAIYEGSSDAVMLLTEEGFFDCNRRTVEMFGLGSREEFVKSHPADLSPPLQPDGRDSLTASRERIAAAFRQGADFFEWVHRRASGEDFPAEVLLSAFEYGGGRVLQATVRDITERKHMELALKGAKEEAERANRAKSEFLANMSHEIRTPMNAIIGFSELLRARVTDEKALDYLRGILAGGKTLLELIEDILDLSKIETGMMEIRWEPVAPRVFCEEIGHIFAARTAEKGIDFAVEVDPLLPEGLILDEVRIRQILLNLIGNAVKFTEKGGVTLVVRAEDPAGDGSQVDLIFEVRDSGIGIPEKQKDLIFEAFRQQEGQSSRKFGGTGLGLTITRRLVEMMGGRISLASELGKGSTFKVHIPGVRVSALVPEAQDAEKDLTEVSFGGASVLLVEDIESNRQVIKGLLEPHGLQLLLAGNGREALDMVQQTKPDLILMDLQMPVMDGYEATRLLKDDRAFNSIPIVALTASSTEHDVTRIRALFDGYLRKPVTKSRLLKEIASILPPSATSAGQTGEESRQDTAGELPAEAARRLAEEFKPRWEEIGSSMLVDDIVSFARDLEELGRLGQAPPLEAYGRELSRLASTFKIDRMMRALERFPLLMGSGRPEAPERPGKAQEES